MAVDPQIWAHGHVIATVPVDASVTYATMNALCAALGAAEPAVRWDNRQWLSIHYILYLGSHDLATAAFCRQVVGDGRLWKLCGLGMVSAPQYHSQSWQDAQEYTSD